MGAFATGGPVEGPGGPNSDGILARLSAGEYVLNAEAVRFYGQPMLDAMNRRLLDLSQASSGTSASGLAAGNSGPPQAMAAPQVPAGLNLVLVDSRNQARQFLESAEGEAMLVEILRKRRMQFGVPT